MKYLKSYKQLFGVSNLNEINKSEKEEISKILDELDISDEQSLELAKNYKKPIQKEPIQNSIKTWDDCDGCKYFDIKSLQQYTGFNYPIYNIINKNELHELEFLSPKQYIHKIAHGFGLSYKDVLFSAYNEKLSDKYAKLMEKGEKFPIGYYNTSNDNQEGRHRAMASMKLGVNIIPVVKITKLNRIDIKKIVLEIKDYSEEELNNYVSKLTKGIVKETSRLDLNELDKYINNRLDIEL